MGYKNITTQKFCLEHGYRDSEYMILNNTGYCIREENEYEITLPVEEVLGQ